MPKKKKRWKGIVENTFKKRSQISTAKKNIKTKSGKANKDVKENRQPSASVFLLYEQVTEMYNLKKKKNEKR